MLLPKQSLMILKTHVGRLHPSGQCYYRDPLFLISVWNMYEQTTQGLFRTSKVSLDYNQRHNVIAEFKAAFKSRQPAVSCTYLALTEQKCSIHLSLIYSEICGRFCRRGFCPWGFCPRGILSLVDFVLGVSVGGWGVGVILS